MQDKPVNLGCLVAYTLWGSVLAIVLWSIGSRDVYLATLGCALSAAAATATVRSYFVASNRMMRNAFELGRDSVTVPLQRVR